MVELLLVHVELGAESVLLPRRARQLLLLLLLLLLLRQLMELLSLQLLLQVGHGGIDLKKTQRQPIRKQTKMIKY